MKINLDSRKILMFSYIYKIEEFFREYNEQYFGAVLKNFYDEEVIRFNKKYDADKEILLNQNIVNLMFFNKNKYFIPFVRFSLNFSSNTNPDKTMDYNYLRTVNLLKNDIKKSTQMQLFNAHEKFTEYKKYFLKSNKINDHTFFNTLQPNNKDNVAYAYMKRLEELFGVSKYNIVIPENICKRIFKKSPPILYGIKFERKMKHKINNIGIETKEYKPIEDKRYYCNIEYDKIYNSDLNTLFEAHKILNKFIKINDDVNEEYTDERRCR